MQSRKWDHRGDRRNGGPDVRWQMGKEAEVDPKAWARGQRRGKRMRWPRAGPPDVLTESL